MIRWCRCAVKGIFLFLGIELPAAQRCVSNTDLYGNTFAMFTMTSLVNIKRIKNGCKATSLVGFLGKQIVFKFYLNCEQEIK